MNTSVRIQFPAALYKEDLLKILRLPESDPSSTQRGLSCALGVSLGGASYCVRAPLHKGLLRVQDFRNSRSMRTYAYLPIPAGIEARAELTHRFLQSKPREYEHLRYEIKQLRREVGEP